jgi:putative SOS response-associated peptidase YedK
MCGRFTHRYSWAELHALMRLWTGAAPIAVEPRYNVAPTQTAPVVRVDEAGHRVAVALRWGLVPFWADDPAIGSRLINARSEEAAGKPSFRAAFKARRCLVPMSDFYEWQAIPGATRKQPWAFRVRGAPLFAVAGLWERWDGRVAHEPLETFALLTCAPNALLAPIHNRMPVIVPPHLHDLWLDPAVTRAEALAEALRPFPAEEMEAVRVGTRVNSPANDGPDLLAPLASE